MNNNAVNWIRKRCGWAGLAAGFVKMTSLFEKMLVMLLFVGISVFSGLSRTQNAAN